MNLHISLLMFWKINLQNIFIQCKFFVNWKNNLYLYVFSSDDLRRCLSIFHYFFYFCCFSANTSYSSNHRTNRKGKLIKMRLLKLQTQKLYKLRGENLKLRSLTKIIANKLCWGYFSNIVKLVIIYFSNTFQIHLAYL